MTPFISRPASAPFGLLSSVLLFWATLASSQAGEAKSLFNGKNLDGWDGDPQFWSVVDGAIRGANQSKVPSSTYLFTKDSYREFRLTFKVKQTLSPKHSTMHSAVAALGERFMDKGDNAHGFKGPLLMFCHDWGIWDAYRRNRIEPAKHKGTLKVSSEKKGEWNAIEILVLGNRIRFVNNGALVFDFTDKPEMLKASPIGLQLHSNGKPQEFFFKDLSLELKPEDKLVSLRKEKEKSSPTEKNETPQSSPQLTALRAWLAQSGDKRPPIAEQPFASASLSAQDLEEAGTHLWADRKAHIKESRAGEMKAKVLEHGDKKMRFEFSKFGQAPPSGHSLFISMHGGGNTATRANDRQWRNQIGLYKPEEGVYLAPRAPTDSWNLWHQGHIDPLFDRLIANLVVFQNVDPNRVYLMGYSAGGDGVYQLAPRMSDRFAAASMMAGHPNETKPQGLRNLPFMIWMGEKDKAYNRNKVAASWGEKLDALQKADSGGYIHQTNIVKGAGHWMNGKDSAALKWMSKHTRNPLPDRVVWRQDNVTHQRFYWLAVDQENRKGGAEVAVSRSGQHFTIEKAEGISALTILLNSHLVKLDQPLKVMMGTKTLFEGVVKHSIAHLAQSLDEREDPELLFSGKVDVKWTNPE